ncbi:unnamed protein product [Ceutorhynchus assimilis]|uniref:Uncharacterized protein n=1 Tax=Ceutorhynchus assimilis TaxID=467358 RepID=A0A9P0DEI9_9CUCU|nr:unnamed protein product [Ceutorhynchus assimilis]
MRSIFFITIFICYYFGFVLCHSDIGRPCPQIFCYVCPKCAENETLVKSPCNNCCLDKCVPKGKPIDCPKIACKKCPTCAENETLIKSLCDNCCLDRCIPTPPRCPKIGCEKCVKCSKNETLVKSPCNNCCLDRCIPKNCPNPPINCLWCPTTCPKGEVMVKSPCGCCHDKCVPIYPEKCPDPPIECLWCPECTEGYTLVKSPCGCCHDQCVKNEICSCPSIRCTPDGITVPGPEPCRCPTCVIPEPGHECYGTFEGTLTCGNLTCCNGICQRELGCDECHDPCPRPYCTPKSIFVYGPKPCRCPYCVEPKPGDKCYESLEGTSTCGEEVTNLTCCNGVCQDIAKPCEDCNCPLMKCSASAVIVSGPKPCRCPHCVVPKPGDKCLETFEGYLTCGADLICCDGVCRKSDASCDVICNCPLVLCITGSVQVPGKEPCRCPTCILPEPGDKCLVTADGSLSCGENLVCSNGICEKKCN